MNYLFVDLIKELEVEKVVVISYFEIAKNFLYDGESHDFWEFVYCDRGNVNIIANDKNIVLNKGQIIFHKPNEFHNIISNNKIAPNIVVISFHCKSKAMKYFENKILNLTTSDKNLLAKIVAESNNAFDLVINDDLSYLKPKEDKPFASLQTIKIYLELFLIQLTRDILKQSELNSSPINRINKMETEAFQNKIFEQIDNYLKENITKKINTDDICKALMLSRSTLQSIFSKHLNMGVIEYFNILKIEVAKQMIRDAEYNFTEISEHLGFSSLHYFSRKFKSITKMSPSEFVVSVKSKL